MIDELEVRKLGLKYQFKKFEVFGDKIYIESRCDSWIAEVGTNEILLKHKNKYSPKMRTHIQRKYRDFDYMFRSIHEHDKFTMNKRHTRNCRMERLFQLI